MSSDFVIRDNVPILDEHKLHDDDGNVIAVIDQDKLEKIVANNNRRIEETGDEVPLIVGHTKDDAPEHEQPEIVGYADRFRVGWLQKLKRRAIFARFKLFRDKAQEVLRKYPRRSAELWLRKLEIDPISLLGASTPERSLGLLRFSSDGMHYSRTLGNSPMNESNDIVQQVMAALEQTDVWQFIKQLMEQEQQAPQEGMAPEGEMPPEEPQMEGGEPEREQEHEQEGDEQHYAAYDSQSTRRGMSLMHPHKYDGHPDHLPGHERYDASAGSGSNTFPPAAQGVNKPEHNLSTSNSHKQANQMFDPKYKMQRDQARIRMRRQEDEKLKLSRELADLKMKFRRAERERDLIQLQAEGLMFDRGEELETGMRMDDSQ